MRLDTMLVPLDGSPLAEQAIPTATALARKAGPRARIDFVTVIPGIPTLDVVEAPGALAAAFNSAFDRQLAYVDEVAERVRATGIDATSGVALDQPVEGILDAAGGTESDLIVMTSHGRGGFARFWLGSVADGVIRRSTVPVLVLKPGDDPRAGGFRPSAVSRLLVPMDGSRDAETALPAAREMALRFDASITLLRILDPAELVPPHFEPIAPLIDGTFLEEQRQQAQRQLEEVAQRLRADGLRVDTALRIESGIAPAISDFAERHACDVIVMSTHGRGGMRRFIVGSVADKVVRLAGIPVLLVPVAAPQVRDEPLRHPAWEREMAAFTDRNAMRSAVVEIDTMPGGSQREVHGLQLTGVFYDAHDDRFSVTLKGSGRTHLTHAITRPRRIDVMHERLRDVLAVEHDDGRTLISVEADEE